MYSPRRSRSATHPVRSGLAFVSLCLLAAGAAPAQPHRFEADIEAFERADSLQPPPTGGTLFVGSSSIVGWKTLPSDFPDLDVLNRGFGGSEISDDERLGYVNVYHPMLDPSGEPREDLFLDDGLHMNERGYALWKRLIEPYLQPPPTGR